MQYLQPGTKYYVYVNYGEAKYSGQKKTAEEPVELQFKECAFDNVYGMSDEAYGMKRISWVADEAVQGKCYDQYGNWQHVKQSRETG